MINKNILFSPAGWWHCILCR